MSSGDTHPMHTHLVTFQVVARTPFNADAYQAAYGGPKGVPGGIDPDMSKTALRDSQDFENWKGSGAQKHSWS